MTPRNIKLFYIRDFFIALRFFAAIQVIYFAHVTGSYTLAMSLFSISTLSQALLEIPTGIFSDKVGRKITTVFATFCAFGSVVFYAIGLGYWYLFIGAVIEGLARALGSGNNEALAYDSLKELNRESEYAKYSGREGSIQQVGFGIAAFAGGFIATRSFALAMWMSVITQFIAFIFTLFIKEPSVVSKSELNPYAHLKEAVRLFKSNPKLRLLLAADTIDESLSESAYQFAPSFINSLWPLWAVGILKASMDAVSAVSFYFSEKVIGKFKSAKTLLVGFICDRTANLIAYGFPTRISPILLGSNSLSYGVKKVAADTVFQEEFSDHQRATMGSLSSIVMSIAFAIVSVAIGYLADIIGPRNILLITEILLVPVIFLYWKLVKHGGDID